MFYCKLFLWFSYEWNSWGLLTTGSSCKGCSLGLYQGCVIRGDDHVNELCGQYDVVIASVDEVLTTMVCDIATSPVPIGTVATILHTHHIVWSRGPRTDGSGTVAQ